MIRRFFWFLLGAITGITGMSWLKKTMTSLADRMTPANVADAAIHSLTAVVNKVVSLIQLGIAKYRAS
jgi:hypothetical protein